MPRKPRLHAPGGVYHVTLRGNHRAAIFGCAADRDRLNAIVAEVLEQLAGRLHAYCWMPNHLHFAIQIDAQPLGTLMQRIASRYARWFQARLETTGHLFERRFHAKLVQADPYFLALVRYIHLNPVAAGLVADPSAYPWSSHHEYVGRRQSPWVKPDLALGMFHHDIARARSAYVTFLRAGLDTGEGFEEPENMASVGPAPVAGPVSVGAPGSQLRHGHRSEARRLHCSLADVVNVYCRANAIDAAEIRTAASSRRLTEARVGIAQLAVAHQIANLETVAAYFGREESSLRKAMARMRRREGGAAALLDVTREIVEILTRDKTSGTSGMSEPGT